MWICILTLFSLARRFFFFYGTWQELPRSRDCSFLSVHKKNMFVCACADGRACMCHSASVSLGDFTYTWKYNNSQLSPVTQGFQWLPASLHGHMIGVVSLKNAKALSTNLIVMLQRYSFLPTFATWGTRSLPGQHAADLCRRKWGSRASTCAHFL